jgi:hypothetical protein
MPAPGSTVETVTAPPSSGAPTDTGTAMLAMLTERGPVGPTRVRSIDEAAIFGADTAWTMAATYLEGYFRSGGKVAWVTRILGPAPVLASRTLQGTGPVPSVTFTANDASAAANSWTLAVIAPLVTGIRLALDIGDTTLTSGDLTTKAEVLAYAGFLDYGTFASAGAGTLPIIAAAAALTGGDDDHVNVTDTQRTAALATMANKGPGQRLLPGDTRTAAAALLGAACAVAPRGAFALWDGADTEDEGVLIAAATTARADDNSAHVQMMAPWGRVPPLVIGGTPRDMPPSIVQAGIYARQDDATGNPNAPAAGDAGIWPMWVQSLKADWTDTERDALNTAGVNVALDLYENGTYRTYGNRTLADPLANRLYLQASNVRLDMALIAEGKGICDRYVHRQFDSKGREASKLAGEITWMLQTYRDLGALFALIDEDTQQELDPGFLVDAGPLVNTPEVLASMRVIVVMRVRRSPASELVTLRIVNILPTEAF